ncbi:MAG: hypothetical protein BMS9Abin33_0853 [Gammaproteobacteria bacterium]|nr:MAG: hypothetical protein BMS9Abin33_0853 [Gammaproteobacteria bacterium]
MIKLVKIRLFSLTILILSVMTAAAAGLPLVTDLREDGREAGRLGMPILVFFYADYCEYCETVNDLYLQPMYSGGEYSNKILFRSVDVTGSLTIRDFTGRKTDHESFASREGASFTPIIRFYDADGNELVPELFGYSSPDFYSAFLDARIDDAIKIMRSAKSANQP